MVNEISVVGYPDYCSVVGSSCGDRGRGMWTSGPASSSARTGSCRFASVVGSGIRQFLISLFDP